MSKTNPWDKTRWALPPFTPGRGYSQDRWEKAFGKRTDGLDEEPPPNEDVYQRKLKEFLENQNVTNRSPGDSKAN